MKRVWTIVNVGAQEKMKGDESPESGSARTTSITSEDNVVDTVEHLRAELRRKNEKLLRMEGELRVAQANFAELEVCSREVEQELESEISRLSRLNRELENINRNLERSLQNVLGRVNSPHLETSELDIKVAQLQKQLQRLEQENDDLQMFVRRLEATNEDLSSELERSQEEIILAQHELEMVKEEVEEATMQSLFQIRNLTVKLKEYTRLMHRLLPIGKLYVIDDVKHSKELIKEIQDQDPQSSDTDDTEEENNELYDENA